MHHLFGTDGMRARIGTDFLTHETLPILAEALACWVRTSVYAHAAPARIVLIHDTRQSCAYIKAHLKAGFLAHGVHVLDAGVLPTPALCSIMHETQSDVGIVISASHNVWLDNGIKIMRAQGKLTADDEAAIEKKYHELFTRATATTLNYQTLATDTVIDGAAYYKKSIITQINRDMLAKNFTVVLDTAHGATSTVARDIFQQAGIDVIMLHDSPSGTNINAQAGALYPRKLQETVIRHGAQAGFAFDGDGDRVIAVSPQGAIKNGDDLLALLAQHPDYRHETTVVGTTMSNGGLEELLNASNKRLLRAPVGDKFVTQLMLQENSYLGGEQSGHIIMRRYLNTGDGIYAALKVLEAMCYTDSLDMRTFTPWPQVLTTIHVRRTENLQQDPFLSIINDAHKTLPTARVSVRYSGTEKNALRIMVESESQEGSQRLVALLAHDLERELQ